MQMERLDLSCLDRLIRPDGLSSTAWYTGRYLNRYRGTWPYAWAIIDEDGPRLVKVKMLELFENVGDNFSIPVELPDGRKTGIPAGSIFRSYEYALCALDDRMNRNYPLAPGAFRYVILRTIPQLMSVKIRTPRGNVDGTEWLFPKSRGFQNPTLVARRLCDIAKEGKNDGVTGVWRRMGFGVLHIFLGQDIDCIRTGERPLIEVDRCRLTVSEDNDLLADCGGQKTYSTSELTMVLALEGTKLATEVKETFCIDTDCGMLVAAFPGLSPSERGHINWIVPGEMPYGRAKKIFDCARRAP